MTTSNEELFERGVAHVKEILGYEDAAAGNRTGFEILVGYIKHTSRVPLTEEQVYTKIDEAIRGALRKISAWKLTENEGSSTVAQDIVFHIREQERLNQLEYGPTKRGL